MKHLSSFVLILLVILVSSCSKSALPDQPSSLVISNNTLKSILTSYPANLISTPIITTSIPEVVAEAQTPINILTNNTVKFVSNNPVIHYNKISLTKVENYLGENLKITRKGSIDSLNNYVILGGKKYYLAQFHFHYNSEHQINGQYSTMEVHFVNIASDNSYAVVGVLINSGEYNSSLNTLFHDSPITVSGVNTFGSFNIASLLPSELNNYYTYSGSLTTPNYGASSATTNGGPVTWIVLKNKITVSSSSFNFYKGIYAETNFRTIQPLNGRKVYENITK
jgi:carbonic anhydrase